MKNTAFIFALFVMFLFAACAQDPIKPQDPNGRYVDIPDIYSYATDTVKPELIRQQVIYDEESDFMNE